MSMIQKREDARTLDRIEADTLVLRRLKNRDGEAFDGWAEKHQATRRQYADYLRKGYPQPHVAVANAERWESMLAYCNEQAAVARAFHKRAVAVCRELLAGRIKATEAGAQARTWEQDEEVERWNALVLTLQEWLWQARGTERKLNAPGGPGIVRTP
jgi:hypothetical protein